MEINDNSAEIKFEAAMKKLSHDWKLKEKEVNAAKSMKLNNLVAELNKVRAEHGDCKKRISMLDERNQVLKDQIREMYIENSKLENFKSKLIDSLRDEEEFRSQSRSPRFVSIEDQGREFFTQAKIRLCYEVFTTFSGYVKQLNDKTIDKSQALYEIRELFGTENSDLYEMFSSLLSRY